MIRASWFFCVHWDLATFGVAFCLCRAFRLWGAFVIWSSVAESPTWFMGYSIACAGQAVAWFGNQGLFFMAFSGMGLSAFSYGVYLV